MCPFCFYFCIQIMLKTDMEDKKSLAGAWVEAARPKTLPASASPVLLGCALAYYDGAFDVVPAPKRCKTTILRPVLRRRKRRS